MLVNIGSPDAPTTAAVRSYLGRFLSDPRILGMPSWVRVPLVYGLIAPVRAPKSAALYRKIWTPGGSPLTVYGEALAAAIGGVYATRYGRPTIDEALDRLGDIDELVVLPLYPQYAAATTARDWLYVEDHALALWEIVNRGRPGETYMIGGGAERANLNVVRELCGLLDEMRPAAPFRPHEALISFVTDRPGHDLRYAVDDTKLRAELGWRPRTQFADGLRRTVRWYLDNRAWWERILSGVYRGERLGLMDKK